LTKKDRVKTYRGGMTNYANARKDIQRWLKEEEENKEVRFSTMFDLYALPNDFPRYAEAKKCTDPYERVSIIEEAFKNDINDSQFIPYIQLHEFEALVFAKPQSIIEKHFEYEEKAPVFTDILNHYNGNSELINDKPETAPSKRLEDIIPEYDKVNDGHDIVRKTGVIALKEKCPHFREWVEKLEALTK
jgi:hypothetical protein